MYVGRVMLKLIRTKEMKQDMPRDRSGGEDEGLPMPRPVY